MKQNSNRIFLALIALVGFLRLTDLIFHTDAATGFFTDSHVLVRYVVLLLPVGYAFALSRTKKPCAQQGTASDGIQTFGYTVAALGCIACGVGAAVMFWMKKMDAFALVCCLLQAVGSLWLWQLARRRIPAPWAGILLCVGAMGLALHRFIQHSSTYYRVGSVVTLLSSLLAMLFLMRLLHLISGGYQLHLERSVCFFGLMTFYFSCVLFLPQQLWGLFAESPAASASCVETMSLAGIGLLGLLSALRTEKLAGEWMQQPVQEMTQTDAKDI